MTHPYWLISTRSDGVHQRCHFDGHDWLVRMRTPDGREVASEALGKLVRKLLPSREWLLAGAGLAMFAVVAWVYAR